MKKYKYNYKIIEYKGDFPRELEGDYVSKGIRYTAQEDKSTKKWIIYTLRIKKPMTKIVKRCDTFKQVCDYIDNLEGVKPFEYGIKWY